MKDSIKLKRKLCIQCWHQFQVTEYGKHHDLCQKCYKAIVLKESKLVGELLGEEYKEKLIKTCEEFCNKCYVKYK